MAAAASPSSRIPSRPTYSCTRCAARKVKCDRQRPCSACVKHNVDCLFNPPQPPRKQQKRIKNQILADRLRNYEALLREQGIDPSKVPDSTHSEPSCVPSHEVTVVQSEGRSKLVENVLWTRVVEEFHDPEDALDGSSNEASDPELSDDDFIYVLNSQTKSRTRLRHPPPDRIHQLWQIFIENVDPVTKAVHVPTLRPAIQKAARDTGTLPRSFEALMFAIYAVSVMSLKDDECKQRLCEPRKTLLSRYVSATKAALSRAKFMGTTSLVVLQALVLHLLAVRDISEPRALWALTGVAVRIAQSMGLERDGASLGLPPFETEMRRRVWWLLKTHDFQTAELCGLSKFRDLDMGADSTKWPTNFNDDQLYPGMPSLPVESKTLTDFVFLAFRGELVNFAARRVAKFRQQGKSFSQWNLDAPGLEKLEMDAAVRELEEFFETKYIRYCDPSQPLQLLTMLVARLAVNVVRFLSHHPRRWAGIEQTPLSERLWIWEISIKLLEQHNMVQSNIQLKQFAWHAAYFMQWHVFIHILDTLRADPLIAEAEKAWQLIGNTYQNIPNMVSDTGKRIYVAMGNLCLKAYSAREAALQNGNICPQPAPDFILQLRQSREIAKARMQARDAKSSQSGDPLSHGQANASNIMSSRLDADVLDPCDTSGSTHLQQSTRSHPPSSPPIGGATEDDPFWFINGFDDSHVSNLNDVMSMDPDFMLAQDPTVEDNAVQTINWEHWDAWLADFNLGRPPP